MAARQPNRSECRELRLKNIELAQELATARSTGAFTTREDARRELERATNELLARCQAIRGAGKGRELFDAIWSFVDLKFKLEAAAADYQKANRLAQEVNEAYNKELHSA